PVARGLGGGNRGRVVNENGRCAIEAEVEVSGPAALGGDRSAPTGTKWGEQIFAHSAPENRRGPAVPDVRLWVGLLGSDSVVDLLRAHVEPAHVDLRMLLLVGLLHQAEQVAAMRRVDDDRSSRVAPAGRGQDKQSRREEPPAHAARRIAGG